MHRLIPAALLALVAVGGEGFAPQHPLADLIGRPITATVTRISDGDTFDVVPSGERRALRIRLFGVDAPESGEAFSNVARNRVRVLIFGKEVRVTGVSVDTYGRLVARVALESGDLATHLLREGLACHYRRYSDDAKYADAERAARAAGAGFWASGAARPRCAAVSTAPGPEPAKSSGFVGNVSSRLFHALTCRNAGCKNCTRRFSSREEAEAAGYRAARDCLR